MRRLCFLLLLPLVFPTAVQGDGEVAETMTAEDKALAESARKEAIEDLQAEVKKADGLLRQARMQRSPQMQALTKQLQEAQNELARARRRPLEDYLADAKKPKPPANQPRNPLRGQEEQVPAPKGLTVILPYTKAYIPQGDHGVDFALVVARFNGEPPTQGFFQIDGKAEQLKATSSDPSILEIVPDPKFTISPFISRLHKPGKATVTVSAGRYQAQQEVEIVEIPVNANAPSAEIIDSLGLPTTKKTVLVEWPNTKSIDCFIYGPEAGHPFLGEHWTFEKYPSLMLSISEGKLYEVGTVKKDNPTRAELSVAEPNTEAKQKPAIQ